MYFREECILKAVLLALHHKSKRRVLAEHEQIHILKYVEVVGI